MRQHPILLEHNFSCQCFVALIFSYHSRLEYGVPSHPSAVVAELAAFASCVHLRSTLRIRTYVDQNHDPTANPFQISAVVIYRLTLHPLAKYPGPFLAKVTDIYLAYYAYKGSRHLAFHRAHVQYGAYVRLGPNLLSVNTPTGLKTIYGFRSNVRKASFYEAFPSTPKAVSVHSAIDKLQHARKRRVMSHAFSDSAIKSLEKYILANVRVGCELLGKRTNGGITEKREDEKGWNDQWNAAHWCEWLVFDIMGDLVFGKAFGMLESPMNRFATQLVGNAAHRHLIVSLQKVPYMLPILMLVVRHPPDNPQLASRQTLLPQDSRPASAVHAIQQRSGYGANQTRSRRRPQGLLLLSP